MTKDKKIADEVVEEDKEDKEDKEDPTSPNYVEGDVLSHEEGREWYIVQCYTGQEYKVQVRVRDLVEEKLWQKRLFNILVPEEETVELKDNKRTEKRTKIYPGYVFVQMVLDDELYYEIRKLMGVAKFIGTKSNPTPVTDDEILRILRKIGDKSKKIEVEFEEDEAVKVVSGPFRGYTGMISEISAEKGVLKVMISVFGRETPVTLDFDQVEKAV
jgi:transcription termination/antitermination protein NusG